MASRTWHEPTSYTHNSLDGISCAGIATCYVLGTNNTLLTTTNGGAAWARLSSGNGRFPSGLESYPPFPSLACPGPNVCFASSGVPSSGGRLVEILKSADGGQSWQAEATRQRLSFVLALDCLSLSYCAAVGTRQAKSGSPSAAVFLQTTNGGTNWTTSPEPKGYPLFRIACATAQQCVGVGGDVPCDGSCPVAGWLLTTADGGKHWAIWFHRSLSPSHPEGATLLTVACLTASQCYAGGYDVWLHSDNGGKSWAVTYPRMGGFSYISSLSCTGRTTCWALGWSGFNGVPIRTMDGGHSWRVIGGNVPRSVSDGQAPGLLALTCPAANRCFAAGKGGLIMSLQGSAASSASSKGGTMRAPPSRTRGGARSV